jgi:hypothetical protein
MASWKVALDGVWAGTFTATVFQDAVGRARKRWALAPEFSRVKRSVRTS